MDILPNEVWKEIIELFPPKDQWGRTHYGGTTALQRLRLVNKFFNTLVTPHLFRDFDTFKLGDNYEDSLDCIETLSNSSQYFRSRAKNLSIPRDSLQLQRSPSRYPSNYVEKFTEKLGKACDAAGLRFDGVHIGGSKDFKYKDWGAGERYIYKQKKDTGDVLNIVRDLVRGYDSFKSVKVLKGYYFRSDILSLTSADGDARPALLQGIEDVDMHHVDLDEDETNRYAPIGSRNNYENNFIVIGKMLRCGAGGNVKRLTVRNPEPDYVIPKFHPLWTTTDALANLQHFGLDGYAVLTTTDILDAIKCLPNLRSLHLLTTRMAKSQRWEQIFNVLPDLLPHLTSVFFESLKYKFDFMDGGYLGFVQRDKWEYAIIKDITCGKEFGRPMLSPFSGDVDALKTLLSILIKRREEKELERDPWMSVFCQRDGIVVTMGMSYIPPGPDPAGPPPPPPPPSDSVGVPPWALSPLTP